MPRYIRPAVSLALLACTLLQAPSAAAQSRDGESRGGKPETPPALVLLVTVDQLRADYFDRWGTQLTGGLARLAREGAVFTRAHQDHATTETAPGHASLLSGRFPRNTGIVRNNAGVQDPQAALIGGGGPGASPFRFRGSTLVDWLRLSDPRSRALSVSRKDRGAILTVGRLPQDVYWYAADGRFTTSTYYGDTLPTWVQRVNARRTAQRLAGSAWTPLLPDSAYTAEDSVIIESGGRDVTFPHALSADTIQAARQLPEFPWIDQLTIDVALEGLSALDLGRGPQTDVLAVSLSATDAIGHRYGPDSKELHDQILRLDRMLGVFLDSLFSLRDSATIAVVLTADHGVAPFPELHFAGKPPGAGRADLTDLISRYGERLAARGVDSTAFDFEYGMLFINREAFTSARVPADSVLRAFARDARRVPGVQRADLVRDLRAMPPGARARDAVARRWYNALPPDLPVELVVTLRPYVYWANVNYATHGSPHDYDAHVPIIFHGPWFQPGRYDRFARVVDIAPTLARVTRATPTERLDGRVLREALR